jgi:hypothetical protein
VPEPEEQWGYKDGREESKSQLEGVLVCLFFFFKWKQDYGTLSKRGHIPFLLE